MSNESNDLNKEKLNNKFIQLIQGKEFILYAGLLELAHKKGLNKLEIKLIQAPSEENNHMAICIARAISKDGETFTDVGDASPDNVVQKIAPHIIRMASTRAKARSLRDFCNIGMVCVEELDEEAIQGDYGGFNQYSNNRCNGNTSSNGTSHSSNRSKNGSANMSEAQRRAILNLAKRRKLSDDELHELVHNEYHTSLDNLTIQTASSLIQSLQSRN